MTKDQKLDFFCLARKRVVLRKTVLIRRKAQGQAKALVKKGEEVLPEAILLEGEAPAGFRSVNFAQKLRASPSQANQFLLKKPGQRVRRGEQLAYKKGTLGFGEIRFFSPLDGLIKDYNKETGVLLLQFLPKHERVFAGVWGVVEEVEGYEVLLRTKVLEVYGVVGTGKLREGMIKVLAKPSDFLLSSQIDNDCHGRIIVGGAMVSSDSFSKALAVGASGIVTGGMHARDFWAAGGGTVSPLGQTSDVGISAVLLEGFGHLPFFDSIYQVFSQNANKIAFIDGDQAKISIPLAEKPEELSNQEEGQLKKLEVGDFVRIVGASNIGLYGKVKGILQEKMIFESGLEDYFVEVEKGKEIMKVPPSNLEILI